MYNLIDDGTVNPDTLVVGIAYRAEGISIVAAALWPKRDLSSRSLEGPCQFTCTFVISLHLVYNRERRLSRQR